eukprot:2965339-Amphidinium_carterae.1
MASFFSCYGEDFRHEKPNGPSVCEPQDAMCFDVLHAQFKDLDDGSGHPAHNAKGWIKGTT